MAKTSRKPLLNPTSEQVQAYVPVGHRPKAVNDERTRERHCYALEVQTKDGQWDEIAHGLTNSAAEVAKHAWGMAHDYNDIVAIPSRIVDLGTVSQYRSARGLETQGE